MDNEVKSQFIDCESDIKEETESIMDRDIGDEIEPIVEDGIKQKELIIESEWLPTNSEDEENEGYHEFVKQCGQNMSNEAVVKNDTDYERYITEYNDGRDDGDYEDDEYEETDDNDSDYEDNEYEESDGHDSDYVDNEYAETDEHDSYHEDNGDHLAELESSEAVDSEDSQESESLSVLKLHKWISDRYISCKCPVCNEKLPNYNELPRHVTLNHKEKIEESESNYDNCGVCKKCNREFISQYSRYLHSIEHGEKASESYIHICKICNFNSKRSYVQIHISKQHRNVVEEFKSSRSVKNVKCPLCSNTYIKRLHLGYHFMDKHPQEYKGKLEYNCSLCRHCPFVEKEQFLQHLIEKHNLNSWKVLNYRKAFEGNDYFACAKCNRLFFRHDAAKLLSHFLEHQTKFGWSCMFCYKKICFRFPPYSHMCLDMMYYYEIRNKTAAVSRKGESKIKSLQEFEEIFRHVCPFCEKEFNKMMNWQHHLRTGHAIDTLKGLQMKIVDNDSNKLRCLICNEVVANFPEQIHAHSFQHLPYKPYKCLLCFKMLSTFKMAIDHSLKPCTDDDFSYDIRSTIMIHCSICDFPMNNDLKTVLEHYENEHNYFEDFFIKESDNSTMTCKICRKKCAQNGKSSGFLHLHDHFDEKTFKCKLCSLSYTTFKSISTHLRQYHNAKTLKQISVKTEAAKALDAIDSNAPKSLKIRKIAKFITYVCPECNQCMANEMSWNTHIRTHHNFFNESNLYIKEADGSLKCPTCSIYINNKKYQQRNHKLSHMPHKSFMCNLCHERGVTLASIYRHMRRRHFALGRFKCPICPEMLQTQYLRIEHLKNTHPREEWPDSLCLICYKILASKSCLTAHMDCHYTVNFENIDEAGGTEILELKNLDVHMDRHKTTDNNKEKVGEYHSSKNINVAEYESSNKNNIKTWKICKDFIEFLSYACPECNEGMTTQELWLSHIRTKHNFFHESNLYVKDSDGSLKCPTCSMAMKPAVYDRQIHKLTHMPYKSFVCNLCYQRTTSTSAFYVHIRKHFVQRTFGCPMCPEILQTQYLRTEHLKNRHPRDEWPEYLCLICFKVLTNKLSFSRHMDFHNAVPGITIESAFNSSHSNDNSDIDVVAESKKEHKNNTKTWYVLKEFQEFIGYVCPECNEGMTTQEHWHRHVRTQHNFFDESHLYIKDADGSFKCPTCSIAIRREASQQHKHKLTHMPYKSFVCNLCHKRCTLLRTMYVHIRQKHLAQGIFECPICSENLETEYQRTEHIKLIHPLKEWPNMMCLVCYKMLTTNNNFIKHMVSHNGDTLGYICYICQSKVFTLRAFNEHMNIHKTNGEAKEKLCNDITLRSPFNSSQSKDTTLTEHAKEENISNVKTEDAAPSQLSLTKSQSNETGIDIVPEAEHLFKRKNMTKFAEVKKKKIDA